MKPSIPHLLLALAAAALPASASTAGDAVKGAALFKSQCSVCHATAAGAPRKLGPNLAGVGNRPAGKAEGFAYSKPMLASGLTWNRQTLDTFLTKPAKTVPGTRMAFAGQANPTSRDDIITYLLTLK